MRRKKRLFHRSTWEKILREEYLKPMSLSINKLALDLRPPGYPDF